VPPCNTEEGIAHLRKTLELDENFALGYYTLSSHCAANGQYTEALDLAEKACAIDSKTPYFVGLLAGLRSRTAGDTSDDLIRQLESRPLGMALFHFVRDEMEPAVECIKEAIAQRDPLIPIFLSSHPFGIKCRTHSRWPKLAGMMNLPNYAEQTD
jgi:tetratricopeptide (TPR) repeat protein